LPETAVKTVEGAIRDEIQAMSSHFTMAVADVQTGYEVELRKIKEGSDAVLADIKSTYNYVKAHWATIGAAALALLAAGFAVGRLV